MWTPLSGRLWGDRPLTRSKCPFVVSAGIDGRGSILIFGSLRPEFPKLVMGSIEPWILLARTSSDRPLRLLVPPRSFASGRNVIGLDPWKCYAGGKNRRLIRAEQRQIALHRSRILSHGPVMPNASSPSSELDCSAARSSTHFPRPRPLWTVTGGTSTPSGRTAAKIIGR